MLLNKLKIGRMFEYEGSIYFKTSKEKESGSCICMNFPSGVLTELDSWAEINVVKYNLTIKDISES